MVEATVHGYEIGGAPLVGLTEGRTHWGRSPNGRLELREDGLLPQLSVRAGTAAAEGVRAAGTPLPERVGGVAREQGRLLLALGPNEWLALGVGAETDAGAEFGARLQEAMAGEHASVIDVTGQRTAITVRGRDATRILAHGCALDLDERAFPADTCAQTVMEGVGVLIVRRTVDDFLLLVRSSFAEHFAAWLDDAATEIWAEALAAE